MSRIVDMHMHTTASDGTWDVEEILSRVIDAGIGVFSVTDHNIMDNSIKMKELVPENIKFYIGVEISCTYNNKEYHITAYDFDENNKALNDLLEYNRNTLIDTNTKIIEYISQLKKIDLLDEYRDYSYERSRGGFKPLNFLMDKGIITEMVEFFKYQNSYDDVAQFKDPKTVIDTIKNAGGKAFLAHPSAYFRGQLLGLDELTQWSDFGIMGIECYSPYLEDIEHAKYYVDFCDKNDLMISAGSDCHGTFNKRSLAKPLVNLDQVRINF